MGRLQLGPADICKIMSFVALVPCIVGCALGMAAVNTHLVADGVDTLHSVQVGEPALRTVCRKCPRSKVSLRTCPTQL